MNLCNLFLFLLACRQVSSNGTFQITLNSFQNPLNKNQDGTYCKPNKSACTMRFFYSVKQPVTYKFNTPQAIASTINFTIGDNAIATSKGYQPNPFPAISNTSNAISTLHVIITVINYHIYGMTTVATFTLLEDHVQFGTADRIITDGFSSINYTVEVWCSEHYYGDCTTYCRETDSYSCTAAGNKTCKAGWQAPHCQTRGAMPCRPDSVPHGSYSPLQSQYTEQETLVVSCDVGYSPRTVNTTLTCLSNGSWDTSWPTCIANKCPKFQFPNGTLSPQTPTKEPSVIGTTVSFTCNLGYYLTGSDSFTCSSNGTWSNALPVCHSYVCPDIVDATKEIVGKDAFYSYYSPKPPNRTPGKIFTQGCWGTYTLVGNPTRLCQNDGTWDGAVIKCLRNCKKIQGFVNGTITYNTVHAGPVEGSTAEFTCNEELGLAGAHKTTCLKSGAWDYPTLPRCLGGCTVGEVNFTNGTMSPTTYATDDMLVGYILTFSCDSNYYLNGSKHLQCEGDEAWNTSFPNCVFLGDVSEHISSMVTSGLTISCGVLLVFIGLVVLLTVIDRCMQTRINASLQKKQSSKSIISSTQITVVGMQNNSKQNTFRMRNIQNSTDNQPKNQCETERGDEDHPMAYSNPVYIEDF